MNSTPIKYQCPQCYSDEIDQNDDRGICARCFLEDYLDLFQVVEDYE